MRLRLYLVALIAALILTGCGGGGRSDGPSGSPQSNGGSNGNAEGEFPALRDALAVHLDSIGVSIGAVPDDVRRAILADCRELGTFADEDDVNDICNAVQQAMARNDPALIDLLVTRLRALEAD